jgi:hypothetical protein
LEQKFYASKKIKNNKEKESQQYYFQLLHKAEASLFPISNFRPVLPPETWTTEVQSSGEPGYCPCCRV